MLKLFGREKIEHPLADLKEARRILGELPTEDPLFCLEEMTHWLASVRDEPSFKAEHRIQLLQLIDESGQAPARRAAREYLQAHRQLKQRELRLWPALHEFWLNIASAYTLAAEQAAKDAGTKASLPLLAARALRALSTQHKWACMRYGTTDNRLWETTARVHRAVGNPQIAQTVVMLATAPQETTVEHELSRLLMFAACSPHSLTPIDMELCERLIGHFAPRFTLSAESTAETPYWIDLGAGNAPHRGPLPAHSLGPICYFGAGQAYDALRILKADISTAGALPSSLDLGATYEFRQVIAVLDHLEAHWAPRLPERRHARQPMKSRLTIARGFDGVIEVLRPTDSMAFASDETESWVVQNVSTGGFGAEVPQLQGDWLRVGCLLGLQTEGSNQWSLGLVRRLTRMGNFQASVGIQTLTRSALPVEVRILTEAMLSEHTETGIILPALRVNDELRLVLRPGIYSPGQMFVVEGAAKDRVLLPTRVIERSPDYEILACREAVRKIS
ncbi:MAG TPA: hypothetical protein VJU83_04100 [Burkholderiales bacterium]|nr:hypothetical protein [Burkholderiales bacterium]